VSRKNLSDVTVTMNAGGRRAGSWAPAVIAVAASFLIAACGSTSSPKGSTSASGGSSHTGSKLILFELPFPCDLNDYAHQLCAGATDEGKELPRGYKLQIKTGINYTDVPAFNSLIQTSLQLNPDGLIIFPNGAAAQVPVLNQACNKGVKIIFVDSEPTSGVSCRSSKVSANDYLMGVEEAKWLLAHPPKSKQVAIVSQQPGSFASNDARVKGFTETIKPAGYEIAATVATTNDLNQTRSLVTNMLTAHPNVGAIFSANGPMGNGTERALKGNRRVVHVTMDGNLSDMPSIEKGTVAANTAQNPYQIGTLSVRYMAKVIQGQKVRKTVYTSLSVIDKTNVEEYVAAGGMR
jgi:ribose transport system substrate-binding protein